MKTKLELPTLTLLLIAHGASLADPVILTQPRSVTNLAGTTARFSVTASRTTPLAYQWLFNSATLLWRATRRKP